MDKSVKSLSKLIDTPRNCAFQYFDGLDLVHDEVEITLNRAKELWNEYYEEMVQKIQEGEEIEVAIWINMKRKYAFEETLIHLQSPQVIRGLLTESKSYPKF